MRRILETSLCAGSLLCACSDAADLAGPGADEGGAKGTAENQSAPLTCTEVKAPTRRLVRLTPSQYQNSVHDIFGLEGEWASTFPADPVVDGFDHNADELLVTPLLADKLEAAAEDIATRADLTRLCAVGDATDTTCLTTLAELLFRRPTTSEELAPYLALAKGAESPQEASQRIVAAMLQSPYFLYRFELGQLDGANSTYALDDFEVASELSFLLWQTSPDEPLRKAARAGKLHAPEDIRATVKSMLKDPRARPMLGRFVTDWLGMTNLLSVPKDPERFPELTTDLRAALLGEIQRFVEQALFQGDGSVKSLLTSSNTYLNPTLAAFYGLPNPDSYDETRATQLTDQHRHGVLTLGGTMLVHGRSNDSSPVRRGKLVRERLLCEPLPPPPPGIAVDPPPLDPTKTARELYAVHTQKEPCAGCHKLMEWWATTT